MKTLIVNLAHILVTGPFLVYVGLVKPTSKWVYAMLFLLAVALVAVFVAHVAKREASPWLALHATLFAALLGYMGGIGAFYGREEIADFTFAFLLAVGLAAFSYHLVRLMQRSWPQQKS